VPRPTPAQLRALSRRDPALGRALRRFGPYPEMPAPPARRLSTFAYLARAVTFQQLAGAAARTIWGRVRTLTPGPGLRPEDVLALDDATLRGAGLSRNKVAALRSLAEHAVAGRLHGPTLARLPDDEVLARLTEVRGIGPWTAQMYLMFKLGRLDVLPSADLGVQEGLKRLHRLDERPAPREVEERTAHWAPLRSVGSWLCWRVVDSGDDPTDGW